MAKKIKAKPEIERLVSIVFDDAAQLDRGQSIPIAKIEKMTNCTRYTGHWTSIIQKLKRRFLKERGIELWHVHEGEAYRLSTHAEQLLINPTRRQRRATRQYNRTAIALESLPADDLTPHQQTLRALKLESVISMRRASKRAIKTQQILSQPRGMSNLYNRTDRKPDSDNCGQESN